MKARGAWAHVLLAKIFVAGEAGCHGDARVGGFGCGFTWLTIAVEFFVSFIPAQRGGWLGRLAASVEVSARTYVVFCGAGLAVSFVASPGLRG
eukprot:COSAG05_NODE_10_length_39559_cov_64.255423_16_plen_93_part_00